MLLRPELKASLFASCVLHDTALSLESKERIRKTPPFMGHSLREGRPQGAESRLQIGLSKLIAPGRQEMKNPAAPTCVWGYGLAQCTSTLFFQCSNCHLDQPSSHLPLPAVGDKKAWLAASACCLPLLPKMSLHLVCWAL